MATLKQLKTFIAVAETKKMSEAAKKLYISQPTVSQTISDLEAEYGVCFFNRYPKKLEITPIGKLFWERALDVMTSYENLNQFMSNAQTIRSLKIGATLTIGNTMLSEIVSNVQTVYPDIDCSFYIENTKILEHRLIHNELDLALIEGIIQNDKIITEPIFEDSLQLVCSNHHPFATMDTLHMSDLHHQSFILRELGSGTRSIFENLMNSYHIPYRVKGECSSGTAILDAVCHNLGITVLSSRCVKHYVNKNLLHTCPIEDMPMHRFFYLCYNKCHPITSQMNDFITLIKST